MKTNLHHVQIKNMDGELSTGRNTRLFVDGKELQGVSKISYEVDAESIGTLKIEMCANVDIDLRSQIDTPEEFNIVNLKGDVIGKFTP